MAKGKRKPEAEQLAEAVELVRQIAEDKRSQAQAAAALERAKKSIRDREKFALIDVVPSCGQSTCFQRQSPTEHLHVAGEYHLPDVSLALHNDFCAHE